MENSEVQLKTEQEINHRLHVLAVDDSHIDRKLLERLLTVSSYQVTCVESGDKALEYLGLLDIEENEYETASILSSSKPEVSKINLIITDYNMPGITGYDLLSEGFFLERHTSCCYVVGECPLENQQVNFIDNDTIMVLRNDINISYKCMECGAEEFLLKPVTLSDLSKLHSHLLNSITHKEQDQEDDEVDAVTDVSSNKRKATSSEPPKRRPRVEELHVS